MISIWIFEIENINKEKIGALTGTFFSKSADAVRRYNFSHCWVRKEKKPFSILKRKIEISFYKYGINQSNCKLYLIFFLIFRFWGIVRNSLLKVLIIMVLFLLIFRVCKVIRWNSGTFFSVRHNKIIRFKSLSDNYNLWNSRYRSVLNLNLYSILFSDLNLQIEYFHKIL